MCDMRKYAFLITLIAGIALAIVGFLLAAPIGATTGPDISSPRMPFAPALFVLGIILMFGSAVVYELTGEADAPS
jgi:hypothetical protein